MRALLHEMMPASASRDIELDGVQVRSVIRLDGEFMLTLAGGSGYWIEDGDRIDLAVVDDVDIRFGISPEPAAAMFEEILTSWQNAAVPLAFVGAPGRDLLIIETADRWLPLPRIPAAHRD